MLGASRIVLGFSLFGGSQRHCIERRCEGAIIGETNIHALDKAFSTSPVIRLEVRMLEIE